MSTKFFSTSDIEQTILPCPFTLTAATPAIEAVQLMSQVRDTCQITSVLVQSDVNLLNHSEQSSCILVVDNNKLVGIFTEKDIVKCTAMGLNLEATTLAEVMSANPVTLKKTQFTNIFIALNLFRQYKIRHLAVIDDQDQVIGLVTPTTVRQLLQAADLLKMRSVDEVMTREVIQAPPTASVLELAQLMTENAVSCVVITNSDSQPIGIVTERDIVQIRALDLDIREIQADVVMSAPVFYMRQEQPLWEAHQQMQQRRIRRLVVVGGSNELLGIVTQTTVLSVLDPLKMYETVNWLQQTVCKLEAEKVEILEKQNIELERQIEERTAQLMAIQQSQLYQQAQQELRERQQAEIKLKQLNQELEDRIFQRTQELQQINDKLVQEIVERNQAQQILQKQLAAIEATIDGIAILRDGKYLYLNKAHIQMFGYDTDEELIGKSWQELYEPEEIARIEREVFPILIKKGHWQGEATAKRRDGSSFNEEVSLTLNQDGELICVCRDITENRQAQTQLQKLILELSNFKYALDQVAIVAITDRQGNINYANDNFCKISQYSRAELIGSTHSMIKSGYHSKEFFQNLWSTITKGEVWRGEIKNRAKDGTYYWVDTTIVPFIDHSGKAWQYLAISNDITNRKQAESALQESEEKFRQLAENIHQVFWMTDPEQSQMLYISPAYEEIWGRSCASLYENPKSFMDAVYADDRQQCAIVMQHKAQGFDIEYRIIRPDGSMRWIRDQAFPLKDETGKVYRVIGIAEDITKVKAAAVALERSQKFLRQVIDTNPNLIFVKDLQGRFILANQALGNLYGKRVEKLIGKTEADFNPNPSEVAYLKLINQQVIRTLQPHTIPERMIITATGETRYFQTITSPLIAPDGKAYQILGVLTDITESKQAEQEISKALEREKELGELKSRFVSMTSHEFRTPLSVISSSAAILKDFAHKLDETKKNKHLDCIQTYVKHTTQLLDDILLINKAENGKLAFEPAPLDLISFCQQLTDEIQLSAPNHTIVFSSHPQTGVIGKVDKKLLRQILINLLSNAIKYSPDSATVNFNLNITESNVICFRIKDEGIGIPEADQVKLFESFHRARNVGNIPGTGLGLSIVAKCVELHKGSIAVNSKVGMGTTFIVKIPLQTLTFLPEFVNNAGE